MQAVRKHTVVACPSQAGRLLSSPAGIPRYATSWFMLDLLTCLPFDLVIALIINSKADYLRLIRMVCRAGPPPAAALLPLADAAGRWAWRMA